MSNVTLIRTSLVLCKDSASTHQGMPPLGVAYIAATLKQYHDVTVIDAYGEAINDFHDFHHGKYLINGLTPQMTIRRIPNNTKVIGISCMFSNEWIYAKYLIKLIKEEFPEADIIIGGEHVTADYDYILETCPQITACVLGEGEETILSTVNALERGTPLEDVSGLAFMKEGAIHKTNARTRIRNINEIPWPAWDLIPLENYLSAGLGYGNYGNRSIPILATRGCPYKCTFCTNPQMWGTNWNAREPEDVIKEIKYYIKTYKIDSFEFFDWVGIMNRKWIIAFASLLIKEDLDIKWAYPTGSRTEALDKEVLTLLKESKMRFIIYPSETGSKKTVDRIKKRINLKKMKKSMRECVKLDIPCEATLIFGFPGQTMFEVLESYLFLIQCAFIGVHEMTCFYFVPYPGSELFFQLLKEKKIKREEGKYEEMLVDFVYNRPFSFKSWSEHIPTFLLPFLTNFGMAFFYMLQFTMRPHRLYIALRNIIQGKPEGFSQCIIYGLYMNIVKGRRRAKASIPL